MLQHLYNEIRAIEIVTEALQALLADDVSSTSVLRPADYRRLQHIREFIEARIDEPFTLETISQEAGMSVNTLQRLFRAVLGLTIFEYVRSRKLIRARNALEREGITIAEASYLAGYSSPSNFATAFRRFFGIPPSSVRAALPPGD
jgi:AraC-like DNA-binding protein